MSDGEQMNWILFVICLLWSIVSGVFIAAGHDENHLQGETNMKMTISVKRTAEREVLPCPFCGKENLHVTEMIKDTYFAIYCEDCKIYGEKCDSEENAVDRWNTRKYIPQK